MHYAEARRPARRDDSGAYVPLEQQDTSLWNDSEIEFAEAVLRSANAHGPSGRYQIEAAIQSAHVARLMRGIPTWPAIIALYDHLLMLTASPVVSLNRALAIGERDGPEAALTEIETLGGDKRMRDYQPYWAARGHVLVELDRRQEAREALTLAIGLSPDEAVRAYLRTRIAGLADG